MGRVPVADECSRRVALTPRPRYPAAAQNAS